jgi:hypothetical protein
MDFLLEEIRNLTSNFTKKKVVLLICRMIPRMVDFGDE